MRRANKDRLLDTFEERIREAEPVLVSDDVPVDAARLTPDSLIWKYFGDYRVALFGFQRVAGAENSLEQLGQAVLDHSVFFSDTVARGRRTIEGMSRVIYSDDPYGAGRRVRDFHKPIKGTISDGSRYHALNPELYYWGHATFVDQLIYTTDMFIRRLTYAEKVQIFEESKLWYSLYGVSDRDQPETYEDFLTYWDAMVERWIPNKTMAYATGYIRKGLPKPKGVPAWLWGILSFPINFFTRTVIAGTMPPRMREISDVAWSDRHERRFQRSAAFIRALNRVINRVPLKVLYVPHAVEGWRREGVDPRRINNGRTARRFGRRGRR